MEANDRSPIVAADDPRLAHFRTLGAHGVRYVVIDNMGGTLYGSPLVTGDVDACPAREEPNLQALAAALIEMDARVL